MLSWTDAVKFMVAGNTYMGLNQTLTGRLESIGSDFVGLVQGGYKSNGVVFACELARLMVFSEARFQWQQMSNGRPGDLFGSPELSILEMPWQNATTGDLLTRMLVDADFAGNHYSTRSVRTGGRIRRMLPDKVTIVLGSQEDAEQPEDALDCEVVGYLYKRSRDRRAEFLPADEVTHFAPIPDPIANYRGMSWLSPIVREIMSDKGMTEHKLKFLENGATPNMVLKMSPDLTPKQVEEFADIFLKEHEGVANAYKTMFLGGGADASVVGANLQQLDFKTVQGAGETRIAAAAGVPPVIVGLSEGLAGSSLNQGNFQAARRQFADRTLRPLWRNAAGSLSTIVPPPAGSRLWYDDRDIAFLREDAMDQAEILSRQALTIESLVRSGFKANTARDAVMSGDFNKLEHSGLFSVQLQPPTTAPPAA